MNRPADRAARRAASTLALLPEVVLENSPEPVRNRVMILDRSDEKTPFELGVCAQKKRLHEPLIEAFWRILPNHK